MSSGASLQFCDDGPTAMSRDAQVRHGTKCGIVHRGARINPYAWQRTIVHEALCALASSSPRCWRWREPSLLAVA